MTWTVSVSLATSRAPALWASSARLKARAVSCVWLADAAASLLAIIQSLRQGNARCTANHYDREIPAVHRKYNANLYDREMPAVHRKYNANHYDREMPAVHRRYNAIFMLIQFMTGKCPLYTANIMPIIMTGKCPLYPQMLHPAVQI